VLSLLTVSAQPVAAAVTACVIDYLNLNDAVFINRIKLFDQLVSRIRARDRHALKVRLLGERRIKWKIDFIPRRYISCGLAAIVYAAALDVTKVTNVMRRAIAARAKDTSPPYRRFQSKS